MSLRYLVAILVAALPTISTAQSHNLDVADHAIDAAFGRDNNVLLCLDQGATHRELRARLDPLISGIDASKEDSFRLILAVIYDTFPCPFSPVRPELELAKSHEVVGRWIFAQSSMNLRHGPKSPAWRRSPGLPPIKCEAILIEPDNTYRVMQIAGNGPCPESGSEAASKFESLPKVQSWRFEPGQRFRIDRTDVPAQFEEWDVFCVKTAFEVGQVKFKPGDLLAYFRRDPRNEIGAATMFRHLQSLK
ncbi:MAG: hypothetical protein WCV99_19105 [Sterolibacterium sp.]|jgi:hypothetical protein